ncbi:serine hydrolase domain-containing protein [Cohnella nanjingensis]|uniref:Beta-lactamase family protein n=1 Tax=Cohnella nanjingensis TaxID=1387779 RepID=A0A7X0VEH7_9BACL|nr:serine hydrolase domain-containing protein [Cohnella nanjingensis]MBB6669564.1 beta-lactamase family protein [Cohnella nanjingensis]
METTALHHGQTDTGPEETGYDSAALRRLNEHYAALIADGTLQGASYLLARDGRIFAHSAMGKRSYREDGPDLLPDTIRKTYSITKMVTAAAILQLIDRGQIYLNQPVSTILPPFDTPMHRDITLFHLLTHTSGMRPDPGFREEPHQLPWFEWGIRERRRIDPSTDWIRIAMSGPLTAETGKEWQYSTVGYALLGEVVSRVSGLSYAEYIEREILIPLGMNRSYFLIPEGLRSEVCVTNPWEERNLDKISYESGEPPTAGNGMYASLRDLYRFGQMLLNGGGLDGKTILSPRAVALMTRNHLSGVRMQGWGANERNFRYGLGVSLDDLDLCSPGTFSHEGYGRSGLYVDPQERLVFAYLAPSRSDYSEAAVVAPKAIVWSGIQ